MDEVEIKIGEETFQIPKSVADKLRSDSRRDTYKELGIDLNQKFDGLLDKLRSENQNASVKDAFAALQAELHNLKKTDAPADKPLDVEKALAERQRELEKQLDQERQNVIKQGVLSEIKARLLAKGWKESYLNVIPAIIAEHYNLEFDNGSALFRDKLTENQIMAGGINERADEIAKKYPDMIAQPLAGLGANGGQVSKIKDREKASSRDLLASGIEQEMVKQGIST